MSALVRVAASPLVRASFRSLRLSRERARPRGSPAQTRYVRAASSAETKTRDENASASASDAADPAPDISKRDLLRTSAAVRLSSYVYKKGDVEPWVTRDGFVLRAQGNTECTRWFVCDELEAEEDSEIPKHPEPAPRRLTRRWFIVRGAAWNDDAVDSVRLSTQIARAWPAPLHEGVPVVCHAGVAEMTETFWPEMEPWIRDASVNHPRAALSFAGHSLGGSMAIVLMAWAMHRCGVATARIEPATTFGSPPVLAADRWAMRRESIARGAGERAERVARELAGGGDWVGELAAAVGVPGAVGGVAMDATKATTTTSRTATDTETETNARAATNENDAFNGANGVENKGFRGSSARVSERATQNGDCALRLAGFAPDAVRAFVLSNDPVPRMWLSADPFFGAALANETVRSVLRSREALFGPGVFSTERFLYEAVGTLYWLRWSPGGTELVVHEQDDAFFEEESVDFFDESAEKKRTEGDPRSFAASGSGGHARRLKMAPPWEGDLAQSLRAAFDHNAGNYVDAVQWLALKKLKLSKSANL